MGKIVFGTLFFCWFCYGCVRLRQSAGSMHPVIIALCAAVLCQYMAYIFHCGHLLAYQRNGYGMRILDITSEICAMLSQLLLTSLSIFLAQGYTILPDRKIPV